MASRYHLILAGGLGTRLAPLSTPEKPKPFLPLLGEQTLLQQTALRLDADTPLMLSCQAGHVEMAKKQLLAAGRAPQHILAEPCARNTGPAITAAALLLQEDAVLTVLPADHYIDDSDSFRHALDQAAQLAKHGWIVTLGITPDRPSAEYGYIQRGASIDAHSYVASRFTEKPNAQTASRYVRTGDYFWNSGIFVFPVGLFLKQMQHHAPNMLETVRSSIRKPAADIVYPDDTAFRQAPSLSIDYALMEHTERIAVIPVSFDWSDLGTFDAIERAKLTLSLN